MDNGGNVNILTLNNETPLHYAVRLGRKDLVQILVSRGADITIRGKKDNKTALELAEDWGVIVMASHLKKIAELQNWLRELGVEQYFQLFVKEELFLEECEALNDGVLDHLGITSTGHRMRILKGVQNLGKNFIKIITKNLKTKKK